MHFVDAPLSSSSMASGAKSLSTGKLVVASASAASPSFAYISFRRQTSIILCSELRVANLNRVEILALS